MAPGRVTARVGEAGRTAAATATAREAAKPAATPGDPGYLLETAERTIAAIDNVMPKINPLTAGFASLTKWIPGTPAANVSADLAPVAGNIAFNALTEMRRASPSGGALGQVSDIEIDLLQSVEGSVRQDQSPSNLVANLTKIRASMERIKKAAELDAAAVLPPGSPRIKVAPNATDALLDELLKRPGGP